MEMLIDTFAPDWLNWLEQTAASLPSESNLYLLLDGAFLPSLHRNLRNVLRPEQRMTLLFDMQSNGREAVRDVSPILISYAVGNAAFTTALEKCSGWPMVSAIVTPESQNELAERLVTWCVVTADGQRFNFRFPDTRRLPGIFNALGEEQQAEMIGPASAWHYIGRNGKWSSLQTPGFGLPVPLTSRLTMHQYSVLVSDSEADEMLVRLQDRGMRFSQLHSSVYTQVADALDAADKAYLEAELRVDWCKAYLENADVMSGTGIAQKLAQWRSEILE